MSGGRKSGVAVDPITLAVVRGALETTQREMTMTMERTGRSSVLTISRDFSNAIFNWTPEMVVQGQDLPIHLGSLILATKAVARYFEGDLHPGDVVLHNDPTYDGSHIADWCMYKPVFFEEELVFWAVSKGHMADAGGPVAGSYNPDARDVFAEGLRIPPIKVCDEGRDRDDILNMLVTNTRTPRNQAGDLRAQRGAVNVGERQLLAILEKYGSDEVKACTNELLDVSEEQMRELVSELPDGVHRGERMVEDIGHGLGDKRIGVEVTVAGDTLKVALEAPEQLPFYTNSFRANTTSAVYLGVLMFLQPPPPYNEGMYRAVEIDYGPTGTMVNAADPAAHVASTTCPAETITDAVRDTLSTAYPDRAAAGWGHCAAVNLAGVDPRNEREYVHMMVSCLMCGAGAVGGLMDGWHAVGPQAGLGGATSGEMEVLEYHYPLVVHSYLLREDSGCPGEWRGGCGVTHEVEAVGHEMTAVIWGEGRKYPASSVSGAGGSAPEEHIGRVELVRADGSVEEMSTNRVVTLAPGERFITHSAGGGGVGVPTARDPELVLADIRDRRVSVAAARDRYGVVLDEAGEAVDTAATERLRAEGERGVSYRVGIDTGGTFTDLVVVDADGKVELFKTPSTPAEPHEAIGNALALAGQARGATVEEFLDGCELIIHGTTVALNSLLTLRGARTGMLCTAGHEDSLEIRLGHKEDGHRYDFAYEPAPMLVPRRLRLPIRGRVLADGSVREPLNEDDVRAAAALYRDEGVETVGVCFLWSFRNPAHEERAAEILAEELPDVRVTLSAELLPQLGEYVRANTVAVNAFVQPRLARHVEQVEALMQRHGYAGSLRYVQSNGGLTGSANFVRRAAAALNSGPAAAPAASSYFAADTDAAGIVTLDMGGTSADMSITDKSAAADLVKDATIGRYPIGLPMVNVVSIGAGGGSIATVDSRGILRVGPESAEAMPGPACYQRGGEEPTVTDALVVLGYLHQEALLGGELPISTGLARRAVESRVAEPLGISVERAALGVFEVINANMVAGVRTVTVERGHDPRDFALLTGGGATAAHAGRLAAELGIEEVLIPRVSSGLCAFGEAIADAKHTLVGSYPSPLPEVDAARLESMLAELEERGREQLRAEGFSDDDMWSERSLDMKYIDQVHQCSVKIPEFEIVADRLGEVADAFHARHEALYTYCERDNVPELLNLEVTVYARGSLPPRGTSEGDEGGAGPTPLEVRPAYFAEDDETARETPVFAGDDIGAAAVVSGPAIVEEPTTTIVVFPGWELRLVTPDLYRMRRVG